VGNYVCLDWSASGEDEPDLAGYIVYRATSSGVTPEPIYFIGASVDLTWWDQGATPGTPYYYIVTAVDIHENQSAPSNEDWVDDSVTGIEDRVPAPTELTLQANAPNPFGASTELRIGLPSDGEVSIEVFDVAGRLVARRTIALPAGWRSVRFDGRDDGGQVLPSGVYFYRVRAAGSTLTKKMVIQR
jgi:hypothetical protein